MIGPLEDPCGLHAFNSVTVRNPGPMIGVGTALPIRPKKDGVWADIPIMS